MKRTVKTVLKQAGQQILIIRCRNCKHYMAGRCSHLGKAVQTPYTTYCTEWHVRSTTKWIETVHQKELQLVDPLNPVERFD